MARADLPHELVTAVREELLALSTSHNGETILQGMATARFHPASDADYAVVAQFVTQFERRRLAQRCRKGDLEFFLDFEAGTAISGIQTAVNVFRH